VSAEPTRTSLRSVGREVGGKLPYTIGHENAGWLHAVGDGVTSIAVGDKVILYPLVTCGLCRARRFGDDVHCEYNLFPWDRHRRWLRGVPEDDGAQRDQARRAYGAADVVGTGGENVDVPTIDLISTEINIIGNLVGSYNQSSGLLQPRGAAPGTSSS
jgi:Alcohol dehydrogenase GroES-like domain